MRTPQSNHYSLGSAYGRYWFVNADNRLVYRIPIVATKTTGRRSPAATEWMTFSGWVATLAGWYVTEIGRQPWLVTGVLTTEEAVTTCPQPTLAFRSHSILVVYALLLAAYIHTLRAMARKSIAVEEFELTAPNFAGTINTGQKDSYQAANRLTPNQSPSS